MSDVRWCHACGAASRVEETGYTCSDCGAIGSTLMTASELREGLQEIEKAEDEGE